MSFLYLTIVALLSFYSKAIDAAGNCSTAACYSFLDEKFPSPVACELNEYTYVIPCTATTTTTVTEFTSTDVFTSTTSVTSPTTTAAAHQGQITARAASQCPYTSTTTYLPNYKGIHSYCNLSQFLQACNCFGYSASTITYPTSTATSTDTDGAGTTTTSTTTILTVTSCPYTSTTLYFGPFDPTTITNTSTTSKTNYISTYTDIVSKTVTSHIAGTTTISAGVATSTVTTTTVPTVYAQKTITTTAVATATSTVTITSSVYVSSETTYTVTTTYMQPYVSPNTCYINEFDIVIQSTAYKVSYTTSTVNATKGITSSVTSTRSLYTASSTTTVPLVTSTSTVKPSTYTQTDIHTNTVKSTRTIKTTTTTYDQFESFATITVPPCDGQDICVNHQSFSTYCQLYSNFYESPPPIKAYTNVSDYSICANYCGNNPKCGFYLWDSVTGDCNNYDSTDQNTDPYPDPSHVFGELSGTSC